MTLADAVASYVSHRRLQGSPFISSSVTLKALCRHCGEIGIKDLTAEHVTTFCDRGGAAQVTRLSRFSGVKGLIDHYSSRGKMPSLVLFRPSQLQVRRAPYIYTSTEIRTLLAAANECQAKASGFSGNTLHLVLTVLYGTGATLQDALSLRRSDLDLLRNRITLGAQARVIRRRTVPVSAQLIDCIRRYLASLPRKGAQDQFLFTTRDGEQLKRNNLILRFKKLSELAALPRSREGHVPRLQDFRFTFAVHRLDAWIKGGANLNEMIPALSAYMGYSKLTKAEQFLDFTPERFRADLNKLSSCAAGKRWSEDVILMRFLSSI